MTDYYLFDFAQLPRHGVPAIGLMFANVKSNLTGASVASISTIMWDPKLLAPMIAVKLEAEVAPIIDAIVSRDPLEQPLVIIADDTCLWRAIPVSTDASPATELPWQTVPAQTTLRSHRYIDKGGLYHLDTSLGVVFADYHYRIDVGFDLEALRYNPMSPVF